MLNQDEQSRLSGFKEMGSMSQSQALEYFELLKKERASMEVGAILQEPYNNLVEVPKKRGRPKK